MQIPRITLNVWTVLLVLVLLMAGFVVFYPPGAEAMISSMERIIGAFGKVTSNVFG